MTTRSLPRTEPLSKHLEFLKTPSLGTIATIRDELYTKPSGGCNQLGSQSSSLTKHVEVPRHLQQTYALERRCFL
jgi:hypothetical protein